MVSDYGDQNWQRFARCKGLSATDPNFFFPGKGESYVHAKEFCAPCVVKSDCILSAITANVQFGIWGGMGERARRKVKHLVARGVPLKVAISRIEAAPNQRVMTVKDEQKGEGGKAKNYAS